MCRCWMLAANLLALLRRLRKLRFTTVADWGTIMVDAKVNSSAR
jgi:hypothetical protein